VGEGVVGDGVLMGVGSEVGAGVGAQVVHSRITHFVVQYCFSEIFHISEPIGGVCPYSPVVSQMTA
jgi:hypothetical protein